jgi:hypothetical protein
MELQLLNRPLHFVNRPSRVLGREGSKCGVAGGVTLYHLSQAVICDDGQRRGGIGIEHLYARRSQGQQLHVNAIAIHVGESLPVKIEQLCQEAWLRPRRCVVDRL